MAGMHNVRRESSRASSNKTNATGDKSGSRPSLIKKAYQSYGGSKLNNNRVMKVTSKASNADIAAASQNIQSFSGVFPIPEPGCKVGSPPKLSSDQEAKYKQVLEYFQHQKDFPVSLKAQNTKREPASDWEKMRLLSRESMLRYLRACRWDVTAAKKRLTETIAWRREFGVDNLDSDEMAKEATSGKETVLGYDNLSRPLHYMHPHRNDTKESPRQMQFAVWILERCIDLMPPGTEQLALLINFVHKSRNPTSIANAKLMLYILQNHYVERLGIALCINVPWVFKMFWNAIQAFIDPVTKSKCKFDEAIKDEVPARQLSSEFGGELDATYKHEEYWNDLVKLTGERRKEMMRRFKEDCNSEIGASEWVIRGGDDETSPFNTKTQEAASSDVGTSSMSSGIPSSGDPAGGEKARSAAVVASDSRAVHSRTPRPEEPDTPLSETPLSRFMTPSDTLNPGPLDRTVSSLAAGNDNKARLATTAEKPAEEEEQGKKERPPSGLHNFEERFNRFNHKIAHVFHHESSSRKSSREGLRDSRGSNGDKAKAAEIDRKENVETGEDLRAKDSLPSATEAAAVAGAAGMGGAAGAVGGAHGDKVQDTAAAPASSPKTKQGSSIHVLYFASAKEAAGIGRQDISLPETPFPLARLGEHLTQLVSDSGKGDAKLFEKVLEMSKWSVDEDMVDEDGLAKMTLSGGEDVAIIPPVSGG